jgi:hypothetical protein
MFKRAAASLNVREPPENVGLDGLAERQQSQSEVRPVRGDQGSCLSFSGLAFAILSRRERLGEQRID